MSIFSDISSTVKDIKSYGASILALSPTANPFGSVAPNYRYPKGNVETHKNLVKFEAIGRVAKGGMLDITLKKMTLLPLGSVTLYMPAGISTGDTFGYDNKDTGVGGELLNGAGNAASMGDAMNTVKGQGKGIAQSLAASGAAKVSEMKGVGGAGAQAQINLGMVNNPHTQMLFKAPGLRTFEFDFKMIPKDAAEAQEIINIIKFFRTFAYPALGSNNSSDGSVNMATYKFPEIFRITYITVGKGENKNISRIMDSYCTGITTKYNATSPTFHANGMPSEVDLHLSFQESKAVNRDLIVKDGY